MGSGVGVLEGIGVAVGIGDSSLVGVAVGNALKPYSSPYFSAALAARPRAGRCRPRALFLAIVMALFSCGLIFFSLELSNFLH